MHPKPTIPFGYCRCGCGEKSPLATKTRNDRGQVRGQPVRYVPGHHPRQPPGPRLDLVCAFCGCAYTRRPSEAKRSRFCSAECREASKKRPPVIIDEHTAHVPLTRGYTAVVDAADAPLVSRYTWYASESDDGRYYAKTGQGDGSTIYLHRLLMDFPPCEVDHWDGDTMNNRRSNLRRATSSQNIANRAPWSSRSLPKGVYRTKTGRFEAKIAKGSGRYFLGVFDAPEEAAKAYDKKASELFGAFARLNFPRDHD